MTDLAHLQLTCAIDALITAYNRYLKGPWDDWEVRRASDAGITLLSFHEFCDRARMNRQFADKWCSVGAYRD
jgi:hypothetical protein